ncbi:MAG: YybH family protein [Gemmatimonadota bacterium]
MCISPPRFTALFAALILVACAPAGEEAATADEGAQVTNAEADRSALFALADVWDAALNGGDIGAVMQVYGDDPVALPPNAPVVEGVEGVQAYWSDFLAQGSVDSRNTPVDAWVSGDLAVMRGTFVSTITPAEGEPLEEEGKWMALFQRQADGSWKAVANIWNSDLPLPGTDS